MKTMGLEMASFEPSCRSSRILYTRSLAWSLIPSSLEVPRIVVLYLNDKIRMLGKAAGRRSRGHTVGFFSCTRSDFVDSFVLVAASHVRK